MNSFCFRILVCAICKRPAGKSTACSLVDFMVFATRLEMRSKAKEPRASGNRKGIRGHRPPDTLQGSMSVYRAIYERCNQLSALAGLLLWRYRKRERSQLIVQCTLYNVQSSRWELYNVQCTLYIAHRTV